MMLFSDPAFRSCLLFSLLVLPVTAFAQTWEPYTGVENLRLLMSDTEVEGKPKEGVTSIGRYNKDGTGELTVWGETFPRTWRIVGDDQVCISAGEGENCARFEKAVGQESVYRAIDTKSGEALEFSVLSADEPVLVDSATGNAGNSGNAAEPSAEEVAKSLANPNTPLASQTFKIQYRMFEGDLPGADDQSGTTVLYQPSFPFKLDSGATVFFRPAFPIILDQPVYDGMDRDFESVSGLGDIGFDLAYGKTTDTGLLWAVGMISTLPTATKDELGPDRWNLGPEFLIGKISKQYVVGALTTYQTDVGGSGDADVSLTTLNAFATFLPGGGWNVGTAPIMSYDHENSQWTLPLNLSVGKTVIWNGRPWKLGVEINYFVDQPDAFGPQWMFGINIAPVVKNVFAGMF